MTITLMKREQKYYCAWNKTLLYIEASDQDTALSISCSSRRLATVSQNNRKETTKVIQQMRKIYNDKIYLLHMQTSKQQLAVAWLQD